MNASPKPNRSKKEISRFEHHNKNGKPNENCLYKNIEDQSCKKDVWRDIHKAEVRHKNAPNINNAETIKFRDQVTENTSGIDYHNIDMRDEVVFVNGKNKDEHEELCLRSSYDITTSTEECVQQQVSLKTPVLLPAESFLLQDFQSKLKRQLLEAKEQMNRQIAELKYDIMAGKQQQIEIAAKLHQQQQHQKQQREQLQEYSAEIEQIVEDRLKIEFEVRHLNTVNKEKIKAAEKSNQQLKQSEKELENLNLLLGNLKEKQQEMQMQFKSTKNATENDIKEEKKLSEAQRKQDFLFLCLQRQIPNSEKEMLELEQELNRMDKQVQELKQSCSDADADLEQLQKETKNVRCCWSIVVKSNTQMDMVWKEMSKEKRKTQEAIKTYACNTCAICKQLKKAELENAKLCQFREIIRRDCNGIELTYNNEMEKLRNLENEIKETALIMPQMELEEKRCRREGILLNSKYKALQRRWQKNHKLKAEMEMGIFQLIEKQLVTDKINKCRVKLLRERAVEQCNKELNLVQAENRLATLNAELANSKNLLSQLCQEKHMLKQQLDLKNLKFDETHKKLKHVQHSLQISMKHAAKLYANCRELEKSSIATAPEHTKISYYENAITVTEEKLNHSLSIWSKHQQDYMMLLQRHNQQLLQHKQQQQAYALLQQRGKEVDNKLEAARKEQKLLQHEVLQRKYEQSKLQQMNLKAQNYNASELESSLDQKALLEDLKAREAQLLQLEADIENIIFEIENYKQEVEELHRTALSWEVKRKMADESVRWRRGELSPSGEICILKAEIQRMNVYCGQLQAKKRLLTQQLNLKADQKHFIFQSKPKSMKTEKQSQNASLSSRQNQISRGAK